MIPRARVVHALPGRLRLKVGSMRGDEGYFRGLSEALAQVEGVRLLKADPRTASVLIEYEEGALDPLAEEALQRKIFVLEYGQGSASHGMAWSLPGWGGLGNETVLDWRLLGAMVLFALSIRQIGQGKVLSPAVSMLWYGYELLERAGRKGG